MCEWTDFFLNVLLSQGIDAGNDTIAICTEYGFSKTPYFTKYIEKTSLYKATPYSFQFAVKNAIHSDPSDPSKTTGDSAGQGNPKTEPLFIDHVWFYYSNKKRFFDVSYGKSFSVADSNLTKYCKESLNSVFNINFTNNTGAIIKTDIHNYIKLTKDKF